MKYVLNDLVTITTDHVPGLVETVPENLVGKIICIEKEANNEISYCISDGRNFRFWFGKEHFRPASEKEIYNKLVEMIR